MESIFESGYFRVNGINSEIIADYILENINMVTLGMGKNSSIQVLIKAIWKEKKKDGDLERVSCGIRILCTLLKVDIKEKIVGSGGEEIFHESVKLNDQLELIPEIIYVLDGDNRNSLSGGGFIRKVEFDQQ